VRRAFAGVDLATLDPFVHMDQMGEVDYAPGEPKGHPSVDNSARSRANSTRVIRSNPAPRGSWVGPLRTGSV
jgi:hypothetical protein